MNTPPPQKNDRILVIDDNQAIRADFKKILQPADAQTTGLEAAGADLFGESSRQTRSAGFTVDTVPSGEEGLARVQAARAVGRPYALAFVDVRMAPGWDGIETTARIFPSDPDIQIIICTAYSDYSWEEMIAKLGQSDRLVILKKPFDPIEVLQLAHALTEKWELGRQARIRLDQLEGMVAARTRELQSANDQLKIEMEERARTEDFLRQTQKMEAVGRLAGGIAHDFNNLLTVIRGFVQCLTTEVMHPSIIVTEALHEIDAAAERAAKLTAQMLMFSHKKQMQPQSINLNEVITQFGGMLMRSLGEGITQIAAEYNQAMQSGMLLRSLGEDIILEIHTQNTPLPVRADPVMIELVVLNLALNARDAMPHGGRLVIRTVTLEIKPEDCQRNVRARPGHFACLSVEDTGCGMAPEALVHLFEPFFTTKEASQGSGLGLASAYGIVKQHEGWIEVESQPEQGSKFKVFLPVESKKAAPVPPLRLVAPAGGKETILLVEDEPPLRHLAKMWLKRQGYCIYEAATGVEALTVWEAHASEIDLLLTDMMMPGGISGRELAEKLLQKKSTLKIIYTTGYSPDTFSQELVLKEGFNFLGKPYHPNKLTETVRRRLDEAE